MCGLPGASAKSHWKRKKKVPHTNTGSFHHSEKSFTNWINLLENYQQQQQQHDDGNWGIICKIDWDPKPIIGNDLQKAFLWTQTTFFLSKSMNKLFFKGPLISLSLSLWVDFSHFKLLARNQGPTKQNDKCASIICVCVCVCAHAKNKLFLNEWFYLQKLLLGRFPIPSTNFS